MKVTNLDFQDIKNSLKTYFKTNSNLTDYDFESSVASVLLDILSANTHFYAFYNNMMLNESSLKTATIYKNVVGNAAKLGYSARSTTASKATVFIELLPDDVYDFVTIPKNTTFSATYQSKTFHFKTINDTFAPRNINGTHIVENLEIVQGVSFTDTFIYNDEYKEFGYKLNNDNIDTQYITVSVIEPSMTDEIEYKRFNTIDDLGKNVFYIDSDNDNRFILSFGDNVITNEPSIGSTVKVSYLITEGSEANLISRFDLISSIPNCTLVNLVTSSAASGGAELESIASIKFNGQRAIEAQNRAITSSDYEYIIKQQNPDIEDINVYGGEKNNPPAYGRVFAAVKLAESYFLTENKKDLIKNKIKEKNVLGIDVIVKEADYIYFDSVTNIKYINGNLSVQDLKTKIEQVSKNYFKSIEKFDVDYAASLLTTKIHEINSGIASVSLINTLYKMVTVEVNTTKSLEITFNNAIQDNLKSSYFEFANLDNCYIISNNGVISLLRDVNGETVSLKMDFGVIDYSIGRISIPSFSITSQSTLLNSIGVPYIKFTASLVDNNLIYAKNDQILVNASNKVVIS